MLGLIDEGRVLNYCAWNESGAGEGRSASGASSKGDSSVSGPWHRWLLHIKGECGKVAPSSALGGSTGTCQAGYAEERCSSYHSECLRLRNLDK